MLAVLGVHVVRVAAHQPGGHRDRRRRAQLGSRAVGVVGSGHDPHLLGAAHEVGVAQPERLPDPHPGLGQQRQQEPITGPRPAPPAPCTSCSALNVRGARCGTSSFTGRVGDRSPRRDVMQERLVGAATRSAATPPTRPATSTPRAGVMLIEPEHRGQMPVHRRRRPPGRPAVQHDHVVGRRSQPRHEPGDVVDAAPRPSRRRSWSRNSNHNFKLVAYARCVFGDRSNAARYAR